MTRVGQCVRRNRALWLAVALAVPVCSYAQPSSKAITVQVTVARSALRARNGVPASLVQVRLIDVLSYADLDLTTRDGRQQLRERVAAAARAVCEQIETLYPGHTESPAYCLRQAIADSDGQIEAAIDAAEHEAEERNIPEHAPRHQ